MRHIYRRFCVSDVKLTELCAMHPIPQIVELCAAIETDLICSPLDSEHTADLVVMAPEQPTEKCFHMVRNLSKSDRTKSDRCRVLDLSRKAHAATRQSGIAFRPIESPSLLPCTTMRDGPGHTYAMSGHTQSDLSTCFNYDEWFK
jgi:hypothetical protein